MALVNEHFLKLPNNYLFADIAKKVNAFKTTHPNVDVISLGIGDVTQPLCPAVIEAIHRAADEMATQASFRGYGPEQGYDFLREAILKNDFLPRGIRLDMNEIFINEGAKSDTTGTAIAATCANARACTAATVAAGTTAANPCRALSRTVRCVCAVCAIATIRSIAARGIHRALANDPERVALRQLNAGTGTRLSAGIGSRAGDGYALGQVEIHRALDGQAAAASRAVAEREARVGVVIRRSTCRAERLSRRGAFGQGRPVCRCGIGHCIDLFPTGLRPRSLHHGAEQGEDQK